MIVIFKIDGTFANGFDVTLEISKNGEIIRIETGKLQFNDHLFDLCQIWENLYFEYITNSPNIIDEVRIAKNSLDTEFNQWLNNSISTLIDIISALNREVKLEDNPQFFLETNNQKLYKLPWSNFLQFLNKKDLSLSEIALPIKEFTKKTLLKLSVFKVLVILGNDDELVNNKWQELQKTLPTTLELELIKPIKFEEIQEKFKENWHIIYFAGFNNIPQSNSGIWINENRFLEFDEPAFIRSVIEVAQKELKLVIFNSCHGLDLAEKYAEFKIQIPHLIVMREQINYKSAYYFFDSFINAFVTGKNIHEALKEARGQLQRSEIDNNTQSISFCPVLFQNAQESLFYVPQPDKLLEKLKKFWRKQRFLILFLIGVLLAIFPAILIDTYLHPTLCNHTANNLECGDKRLIKFPIKQEQSKAEKKGRKFLKNGKYKEAEISLKKAWENEKDPSILIALNNAQVLRNIDQYKQKVFTLAVMLPFSDDATLKNISKNLLAGVAWKQDKINKDPDNQTPKLLILIGNDENDEDDGKTIAEELGKRGDLLGVIGPYSSKVAHSVIPVYSKYKLPLISPRNSNLDLTQLDTSFYFRMFSNTEIMAKHLVKHLQDQYQQVTQAHIIDVKQKITETLFYNHFQTAFDGSDLSKNKQTQDTQSAQNTNKTAFIKIIAIDNAPEEENKKIEIRIDGKLDYYITENQKEFKQSNNISLTVPFFIPNSYNNNDMVEDFKTFLRKIKEDTINWYGYSSADATQVLFQAISNLITEGKTPTRELIRNEISKPDFQTKGLTGQISFKGSDRAEQVNYLIKPNCSNNPNCSWELVDKYSE